MLIVQILVGMLIAVWALIILSGLLNVHNLADVLLIAYLTMTEWCLVAYWLAIR